MSTLDELKPVSVELGGTRGGPKVRTLRRDNWATSPAVTAAVLTSFVVYATFVAFQDGNFYVGAAAHRDLISPFYSPCITYNCLAYPGAHPSLIMRFWKFSPALPILIVPAGFRLTCYYYRKAYYRSFWQSPPACSVADGHKKYTGETRIPLIFQNIHRYFFYLAMIFNVILTADAVVAYNMPGQGIGVSVGSLVLTLNACFLWLYTLSCHAGRHLCGGHVNLFSKHPVRHKTWKLMTALNTKHMPIAWCSLIIVALTDLYVRLVASGAFNDPKIF